LDPVKLRIAKEEFAQLEKAGIVRRSTSCWSSPLHMVPKKDGSWHPCGDFCRLNVVTVPDRYPLPNLSDFSINLGGCKIFSKTDLVKGYHQVPVDPVDVPKTAIITPFGLYEFLFMPFGLGNAAQTFQRLMDQGLPYAFVYLDDILVASGSAQEHNMFSISTASFQSSRPMVSSSTKPSVFSSSNKSSFWDTRFQQKAFLLFLNMSQQFRISLSLLQFSSSKGFLEWSISIEGFFQVLQLSSSHLQMLCKARLSIGMD
jgi:hypothetical protein